jgi:hypothetical protein
MSYDTGAIARGQRYRRTLSSIPGGFLGSEAPESTGPELRLEEKSMLKHVLILATLSFTTPLLAQTPPASSPTSAPTAANQSTAAPSPAKSLGVFAYPQKQQSADQQLKDENECFASAKQETGIDPQAPPPAAKTEEQKKAEQQAAADNAKQAKGGRVKGAAKGAAGGAAIGAVADDEAGKGASAGAVAGTVVGGAKQRRANRASKQQAAQATAQQQQQEEAQAKGKYQQGIDTFKRAFSACMDARGYSIK